MNTNIKRGDVVIVCIVSSVLYVSCIRKWWVHIRYIL